MLEFSLTKKTRIYLDFTFFAAIALFFYLDESGFGIMSIAACIIHETGHLTALYKEKRDINSLTFYGGGIKIGYEKNLDASYFILVAGSLFNFILFAVLYFSFQENYELKIFAIINLIIGIFNLLPLKYFDGARITEKILLKILSLEKALYLLKKIEIIAIIIAMFFIVIIMIFGQVNISVLIVMIYVIITDIIIKTK